MRYDKQKTEQRLKNVPSKHRVFIYNAAVIIEFLNQTLMPLHYFIHPNKLREMDKDKTKFSELDFNRKEDFKEMLSIGDLYEYYKMFREQSDFTQPIESRYKFAIILKRLNYYKNGWQFENKRVGRAQVIFLKPAQLRVKVAPEIRSKFPPLKPDLSKGQVELKPPSVDNPKPTKPHTLPVKQEVKENRFKEAKGSRFIEAIGNTEQ